MKGFVQSKIVWGMFLFFFWGCAGVKALDYIQDVHPYKKTFYLGYDEVVERTKNVLGELGWEITKETDPSIYERRSSVNEKESKTFLFARLVKTSLVKVDGDVRINVLIYSAKENSTEAEIRYQRITSIPFKKFRDYRHDKLAEKIFERIEKGVSSSSAQ